MSGDIDAIRVADLISELVTASRAGDRESEAAAATALADLYGRLLGEVVIARHHDAASVVH